MSRCPALGVASQGETVEGAEDNIGEAVGLYLSASDEDAELERISTERGLKVAYLEGESRSCVGAPPTEAIRLRSHSRLSAPLRPKFH